MLNRSISPSNSCQKLVFSSWWEKAFMIEVFFDVYLQSMIYIPDIY